MPVIPDVVGVELVPDWVCEVLSPPTATLVRDEKMDVYAREGVNHLWVVDSRSQTLEVYQLEDRRWRLRGTHMENSQVHATPFEALPVKLASLWER
jgi:Uma2 family endonuclease